MTSEEEQLSDWLNAVCLLLTVSSVTDRPMRASRAASWAESWHSWPGTQRGPKTRRNPQTPEPADTPDRPRGLTGERQELKQAPILLSGPKLGQEASGVFWEHPNREQIGPPLVWRPYLLPADRLQKEDHSVGLWEHIPGQ